MPQAGAQVQSSGNRRQVFIGAPHHISACANKILEASLESGIERGSE